ncbi:hypothetical protein AMATHDRAFT_86072 [Amanita thiersii Skay4041]|uniref:Protein kinase domain-containing protein n=1 Tax=Amanita thiersii Skay4041 TaxID=703135 RepID=A0A2A9NQN0_9AGAR|nr:hypothetical protein AMATHDRAFT_86072 [Amanita thiersii Skay4041]
MSKDKPDELNRVVHYPEISTTDWQFWESKRSWFEKHAYTLYKVEYVHVEALGIMDPVNRYSTRRESVVGRFPFAPCSGSIIDGVLRTVFVYPLIPFIHNMNMVYVQPHIAFAQDSQNRHVAIKLVVAGTQEANILEYLTEASSEIDINSFQGVIPVLEVLHYDEDYLFFVMPRVEHALDFVYCMLKVCINNSNCTRGYWRSQLLVNYIWNDFFRDENDMKFHQHMHSQNMIRYAIFDFNLGVKLPDSVDPSTFRLPIEFASEGPWCEPFDRAHGVLDYRPFAYDVACMGILIYQELGDIITFAPLLAPLIDMMVTPDIDKRFAAQQEFFSKLKSEMEEEELKRTISTDIPEVTTPWRDFQRCNGLSNEFIQKWSAYRVPPPSVPRRILRAFCGHAWGWNTVHCIRRIFQTIRRFIFFWGPSRVPLSLPV